MTETRMLHERERKELASLMVAAWKKCLTLSDKEERINVADRKPRGTHVKMTG